MNHIANLKREQRRKEIQEYLSHHPDASLKEIGDLLGVTKQRAHIVLTALGIQTQYQRRRHFVRESETEILRYMASGYTNRQIAAQLGISKWTIDSRVKFIFAKLRAHNRAEAVKLAKQQGLI